MLAGSVLQLLLLVAIVGTSALEHGDANTNATQTSTGVDSSEPDRVTEEANNDTLTAAPGLQHTENIGKVESQREIHEDNEQHTEGKEAKLAHNETTTTPKSPELIRQPTSQTEVLKNKTTDRTDGGKLPRTPVPRLSEESESLESEELMADGDYRDSEQQTNARDYFYQKPIDEKQGNYLKNQNALDTSSSMEYSSGDGEEKNSDSMAIPAQVQSNHKEIKLTSVTNERKEKPKLLAVLGEHSDVSSVQEDQPPRRNGNSEQCNAQLCHDHEDFSVKVSASEGLIIPSGITLTIRCTVASGWNNSAIVKWHLPTEVAKESKESNSGKDVTDEAEGQEESGNDKWDIFNPRVNITHEFYEQRAKGKQTIISTLRVVNISDSDSGKYTCFATLVDRCCHRNATVGLRIYTPPSYALDFAIVGAVCFIEFVVILYFKTTGRRKKTRNVSRSSGNGYSANYSPVPTDRDNLKEIQSVKT